MENSRNTKEHVKTKSYKTVWDEAKGNSKKEKAKSILDDYDYCKYEGIRYDTKIQEKIKTDLAISEDDNFMALINWVALWKTNRILIITPEIKEKLIKLRDKDYKYDKKEAKTLIEDLLKCKGVQIAMASTILHFFKPELFPIIDKRAWRAINKIYSNGEFSCDDENPPKCNKSISRTINIKVEQYFDYRKKCEELAAKLGIKIEEIDQFLYQIDKKTGASIDSVYIYDTPNNE